MPKPKSALVRKTPDPVIPEIQSTIAKLQTVIYECLVHSEVALRHLDQCGFSKTEEQREMWLKACASTEALARMYRAQWKEILICTNDRVG